MSRAQAIKGANLAQTTGYQYFDGERTPPSRDKVLQLALGLQLDYDQTQLLLRAADKSPLYVKVKRDMAVIYALSHDLPLSSVQATLQELKLPALGEEERHE